MKLLFLTSRLPFPPNRGDKLRVFNLLKHLSKKHEITLISFVASEEEKTLAAGLMPYCGKIELVVLRPWRSYLNCLMGLFSTDPLQVSYYRSARMKERVLAACGDSRFDAAYAHLFRMAPYAALIKGAKVALDLCDAVSLHMKRTVAYNRSVLWPVYALEAGRISRYEKKLLKSFSRVIFISSVDRDAVAGQTDISGKISIISNGVDKQPHAAASADDHKPPKVAFLGYLSTFYNSDAVLYFYRKIFPLIKKRIPEVKFSIIGAGCSREIRKLGEDKSVELHLDLPEVQKVLKEALVFVCPLRIGSGIQNKILEAMALGIPVVTTDIGCNGLGAVHNKEILVAGDPASFAEEVTALINDVSLRSRICVKAREFVSSNYSWDAAVEKFEAIFK